MVQKIYQNNEYTSGFISFVAETADEVKDIPVTKANMGSQVYVIENKTTYVLDSQGTWHPKPTSGGGEPVEAIMSWGYISETV